MTSRASSPAWRRQRLRRAAAHRPPRPAVPLQRLPAGDRAWDRLSQQDGLRKATASAASIRTQMTTSLCLYPLQQRAGTLACRPADHSQRSQVSDGWRPMTITKGSHKRAAPASIGPPMASTTPLRSEALERPHARAGTRARGQERPQAGCCWRQQGCNGGCELAECLLQQRPRRWLILPSLTLHRTINCMGYCALSSDPAIVCVMHSACSLSLVQRT